VTGVVDTMTGVVDVVDVVDTMTDVVDVVDVVDIVDVDTNPGAMTGVIIADKNPREIRTLITILKNILLNFSIMKMLGAHSYFLYVEKCCTIFNSTELTRDAYRYQ
jgi:hypothetical protein